MKFSKSHEWIKTHLDQGTVGVTEHAQKELGEIVYVELPKIGKAVKAGEEVAVLESTKAAADVYSPVSGTIVEINQTLQDQPELINKSAEDNGWIYKIQLNQPSELNALMDEKTYLSQVH